MKLINILTLVFANILCVLSLPTNSNNDLEDISVIDKAILNDKSINILMENLVNTNDNNIEKRKVGCDKSIIIQAMCTLSGEVKNLGLWSRCDYDCMRETYWACQNDCFATKSCGCSNV